MHVAMDLCIIYCLQCFVKNKHVYSILLFCIFQISVSRHQKKNVETKKANYGFFATERKRFKEFELETKHIQVDMEIPKMVCSMKRVWKNDERKRNRRRETIYISLWCCSHFVRHMVRKEYDLDRERTKGASENPSLYIQPLDKRVNHDMSFTSSIKVVHTSPSDWRSKTCTTIPLVTILSRWFARLIAQIHNLSRFQASVGSGPVFCDVELRGSLFPSLGSVVVYPGRLNSSWTTCGSNTEMSNEETCLI